MELQERLAKSRKSAKNNPVFKGYKILVVDDEADLLEIISDELLFEKAQVETCLNVPEALLKMAATEFDLILSDMRMPGGDGAELVREVRARYGLATKIILLTGFAEFKIEEAYQIGAEGYIHKPFHLKDLKKHMMRILRGSQTSKVCEQRVEAKIGLPENLSAAIQIYQIHWGRGGFSLNLPRYSRPPSDLVRISFPEGDVVGFCRWIQKSKDISCQRFGIEVLECSSEIINILEQYQPGWSQMVPYIPL